MARDDTENLRRNIQKAFNLAYPASKTTDSNVPQSTQPERSAWEKPVHPEKKGLKPVAFYPVLPDFASGTAIGPSWNLLRFDKPPLPAAKGHRDNRIDAAFLMTSEHPDKKAWELAKAAHQAKPADYDDPGNPPACWSLLLPQDQGATPLIQKIFNERDPEHADEGLMARVGEATANGELRIPLDRKKFYSNAMSQDKPVGRHTRQVVLSLPSKQQFSATAASSDFSAAHYYPIGQVNLLRSDRGKLGQQKRTTDGDIDEMQKVLPDQVMVLPHEPNMMELANMFYARDDFDPTFEQKMKAIMEQAEVEATAINGATQEDGDEDRQPPGEGEAEDVEMAEG